MSVLIQDNIGELDTDRQEELKMARRREEEEEEKGRKSALLFGSEDTFDSIASLEEKVLLLRRITQLVNKNHQYRFINIPVEEVNFIISATNKYTERSAQLWSSECSQTQLRHCASMWRTS